MGCILMVRMPKLLSCVRIAVSGRLLPKSYLIFLDSK